MDIINYKFLQNLPSAPPTNSKAFISKNAEIKQERPVKSAAISSGATTLLSYSEFKKEFITDILKKLSCA
jgi:hypothetical protein